MNSIISENYHKHHKIIIRTSGNFIGTAVFTFGCITGDKLVYKVVFAAANARVNFYKTVRFYVIYFYFNFLILRSVALLERGFASISASLGSTFLNGSSPSGVFPHMHIGALLGHSQPLQNS